MDTSDRPLAYVQTIQSLVPIPGADRIEVAKVLGWHVIVKKGAYKLGDPVVYVEIDSILPPWDFFKNDNLDKYNYRIKTICMRNQISQGYCIPIPALLTHPSRKLQLTSVPTATEEGELEIQSLQDLETNEMIPLSPNRDMTELIGIKKYEVANTANINGKARMNSFPSFLVKTDQPRIQNLPKHPIDFCDVEFEVTEKLEGTSITAYFHAGKFGICSRNLSLEIEPDSDSVAVKTLVEMGIRQSLEAHGGSIALQGELIGPGIQLNIYGLKTYEWRIFDIYLIREKRYATSNERLDILRTLKLESVAAPILATKKIGGMTVDEILTYAEGGSVLKKEVQREGVVFKSCKVLGGRVVSFKAISNVYELKKAKDGEIQDFKKETQNGSKDTKKNAHQHHRKKEMRKATKDKNNAQDCKEETQNIKEDAQDCKKEQNTTKETKNNAQDFKEETQSAIEDIKEDVQDSKKGMQNATKDI